MIKYLATNQTVGHLGIQAENGRPNRLRMLMAMKHGWPALDQCCCVSNLRLVCLCRGTGEALTGTGEAPKGYEGSYGVLCEALKGYS